MTFKSFITQLDMWSKMKNIIESLFHLKDTYSFTSLKTDGIGCSLTFTQGKKKKNKKSKIDTYLEDLESYQEFEGKKIVAIDPNKGNLVYCYDGNKVLRYTQNDRRKVSRKTKYKKIRKNLNKKYLNETKQNVDDEIQKLSVFDSKTTIVEKYQDYIREKEDF